MDIYAEKLIIVSGPSGAGKTTVCQHLLKSFPELVLTISETTRPQRSGETDGKDYTFVSKEQFQERILRYHYFEWVAHHDYHYATPKVSLFQLIQSGKVPLLDIEVRGKKSIAQFFKNHLSLFISPKNIKQLRSRLRDRGTETDGNLEVRLERAIAELKVKHEFHHVIINDRLENTLQSAEQLVKEYLHG